MQRDQDIALMQAFTASLFNTDDFNPRRVAVSLLVAAQLVIGDDALDRETFVAALRATLDDLEGGEVRTIN